jgi:hypothetical protein
MMCIARHHPHSSYSSPPTYHPIQFRSSHCPLQILLGTTHIRCLIYFSSLTNFFVSLLPTCEAFLIVFVEYVPSLFHSFSSLSFYSLIFFFESSLFSFVFFLLTMFKQFLSTNSFFFHSCPIGTFVK